MSTIYNNKKYFDDEPFNTLFPEELDLEITTGRCEVATIFPGALCIFNPSTYANGFNVAAADGLPADMNAAGIVFRIFSCEIPPYMVNYPTIPFPKANSYTYSVGDNARFVEWKPNMKGWLYCSNLTAVQGALLKIDSNPVGEVIAIGTSDTGIFAWSVLSSVSGKDWVYARCIGIVRGDAA